MALRHAAPRRASWVAFLLLGCGAGQTPSYAPPASSGDLPTNAADPQEAEERALVARFRDIAVVLDTTTGARFVEVGPRIERCSLTAKQCFIRLRLLREPSLFHYVSANLRSPDIASVEPIDAIRSGKLSRESPLARPCARAGEDCEIAVNLARLKEVRRFAQSTVVIIASRKELPEEKSAREAAEREREKAEREACIAACVAKAPPAGAADAQGCTCRMHV